MRAEPPFEIGFDHDSVAEVAVTEILPNCGVAGVVKGIAAPNEEIDGDDVRLTLLVTVALTTYGVPLTSFPTVQLVDGSAKVQLLFAPLGTATPEDVATCVMTVNIFIGLPPVAGSG